MSRVARHAATDLLLHVVGRATQRTGAAAQARPVDSCRARHNPWLFGRAWARPNFTCRVLAHLARLGSTGLPEPAPPASRAEPNRPEMAERKGSRKEEVVTREYTINLHKRLHGWYFISLLLFPCCHRVLFDLVRSRGSASRRCNSRYD
jgi:hypothetical protein